MHSLRIGKNEYVVGLFWRNATTSRQSQVVVEARSSADFLNESLRSSNAPEYDAYSVLKRPNGCQYGLGKLDGHSRLLHKPSLVVSAIDFAPEDFRAWLQFDDGVLIIGISQGTILANGDFWGTAEAAESVWRELNLSDNGQEIVTTSEEQSLAQIETWLNKPRGTICHLHKRYIPRKTLVFLFFTIIVASALGNYLWQAKLEADRLQLEIMRRNAQEVYVDPALVFPPVWKEAPSPADVYKNCLQAMYMVPPFEHGWASRSITCTVSGISKANIEIEWKRQDYGRYTELPLGAVLNSEKPDEVSTSETVFNLCPKSSYPELPPREKTELLIWEAARIFNPQSPPLKITWRPVLTKEVGKAPYKQEVKASWQAASWELGPLQSRPDSFIACIEECPGVVMNQINLTRSGDKQWWVLQGRIYVPSGN